MWTEAALASESRPYRRDVWRVVETQFRAATMRITDSLEEQAILEAVLEDSKPPLPPGCAGLHYLLATPFRYLPYPYGSRFRRAGQPDGAFYAAEVLNTAIAETASCRLLFLAESPAMLEPQQPVEHTAFRISCRTDRHVDLTRPPLDRDRARWTHATDHGDCQDLADHARAARIEAIRYESVRDPDRRANLAILSPAAFAAKTPSELRTWHVFARREAVRAWCESPREAVEFSRAQFAADPRLAG